MIILSLVDIVVLFTGFESFQTFTTIQFLQKLFHGQRQGSYWIKKIAVNKLDPLQKDGKLIGNSMSLYCENE